MVSIENAWPRVAKLFPGKSLPDFRFMAIGTSFTLTSLLASGPTRVDFPSGAIILGITAGVNVSSQAGTQTIRSLDSFAASIDYPNNEGLITGGRMSGRAIFGIGERCEFPAKEIVIGVNGSLSYVVENLTTSTIIVYVLHHCLIPRTRG
jgi:hypothetical protein